MAEDEDGTESSHEDDFTEAVGNLVTVDRALFFTVVDYIVKNDLAEKFSEYLADQGHNEILMDVATANKLKRFFVASKLTDTKARMIVRCSCGGGGEFHSTNGGTVVAGVRG